MATALLRFMGIKPRDGKGNAAPSEAQAPAATPDIDFAEISKRIFASGRPTVRPTDVHDHRNNIDAMATHLDRVIGEHYVVFNLSNKNRNLIDYGKFHNAVLEFQPYSRSDLADDTPAMGQVFRACYALAFWHAWGHETQAVLHCNTGVLRTGFMVACYLVYTGACSSVEQGLHIFASKRNLEPDDVAGFTARLLPSWRFLMNQIDKHMHGPPALPKVWRLNYVVVNAPGLSRPSDKDFPVLQLFEGPKVMFDTTKDCKPDDTIRWEDGKLIVEIGRLLCGDYQLWLLTPSRDRQANVSADLAVPDGGSSGHTRQPVRKHAARFAFHSSMLEEGINTYASSEVDIWRSGIDKRDFSLTLLTGTVPVDVVIQSNTDKAVKRSYINLKGPPSIVKGAEEYSAHSYVFPDAKALKQLLSEGFDETAAVCALQRAGNNMGKTREYLAAPIMREYFKEPAALRDLKLLRDTLSMEEVAAAFLARGNVGRKKKGIGLDELDVGGLLEAAKLGNVGIGTGLGPGEGGDGGKGGKRRRKGGKAGKKSSGNESDTTESSEDDNRADSQEEEDEEEALAEFVGGAGGGPSGPAPKLFEGDAAAQDEEEEEEEPLEEEEEETGPWLMKDHPIFCRWFKMLADGKPKAEVLVELEKDKFNPALLDQDANAPVPEGLPAAVVPLKDWEFFQKYFKMMKVGLPRPVVEHKMLSENCNPAILDADESAVVLACNVSPPKKQKSNKPQIVRKKLHWVPIRGKIEGSIWSGPPGDLIAAAAQLIDNEAEFEKLFIQKPEDLKKKKKKDKGDTGVVQLLDGKRAMNAGIALAKLKMSFSEVVGCLKGMCCRSSHHLLTTTELFNLVTLCPTDEEIKLIKDYKGDTNRLGQAEKFMLAVVDVPQAKQRAEGLVFQSGFDERLKETYARITTFQSAIQQLRNASRLQRFLKAVLVLGNKMNGVTTSTKRQLVKAFTVNSLHQLYLTKAFDQQTSVLQYLIKLLKKKDPDLLKLSKDFKGNILAEAKRLPLDIMNEEMKEMRAGLTSLEAVVREAAQAGAGWTSMTEGGGHGAVYAEEDVDDSKDAPTAGATGDGAEPVAPPEGTDPATVTSGAGTEQPTGERTKKKRKRIRRRVEPLPEFASLAQTELAKLEQTFTEAQTSYKDMIKFWKEDSELPADELFGNLHLFIQTFDSTLNTMIDKKKKEKEAKRRAKEMAHTKRVAARHRAREAGEEVSESSEESEEEAESDSSSGFDNPEANESKGMAWGSATDAADDDDEEEEEEEEVKEMRPSQQNKRNSSGGDAEEKESHSSSAADPRAGLLAAIKAREVPEGKAESKEATTASPRASLLAAIAKRHSSGEEKADREPHKDTGWKVGAEQEDDPEAGGRNALLDAIRAKHKDA